MDRKRRRGIRRGGRRAKIGVEPVAFYRDIHFNLFNKNLNEYYNVKIYSMCNNDDMGAPSSSRKSLGPG